LSARLAWGNSVVRLRGFAAGCGCVRRVDVVVKVCNGFINERIESNIKGSRIERHATGGAYAGRRGRILTRDRAPQVGCKPLFIAARNGHVAVVELLVAKGADKDAPNKVRHVRGGDVGCSKCVRFLLGFGVRLLCVGVSTRVGGCARLCTLFVAPTWWM
jgi:hypothetical protein